MVLNSKKHDQWYVLYTMSRHEKKIDSYLKKEGYESFLPVHKTVRQWSDRKCELTLPLFPNYLFVKTNPRDFWRIITINGVIRFVSNGKVPAPVSQSTIQSLQKILQGKFELKECLINEGEQVRVSSGPFEGMEGKFLKYGNKNMLVIVIDLILRSLMLEIDPSRIQKIKSSYNY